jgi:DNA-binding transcriptional MerR regulator
MKIGEVAKAAGIGIDAIRFYQREGLIPTPAAALLDIATTQ